MRTIVLALALAGCLDSEPGSVATCEAIACAHVPECSPLTAGAWDWRSEEACLASFACGDRPERCLEEIEALPCLSEPPTDDELNASTRAMKAVREACGAL